MASSVGEQLQSAFTVAEDLQEDGRAEPGEDGDLADWLTEAVGSALERLMASPFGRRHLHLDPCPRSATLAVLGEPEDDRHGWKALSAVLTGMVLNDCGDAVLGIA